MKRKSINAEDNFLKYLVISIVIHGVLFFLLTQTGFGTQSLNHQPRDYQEIQLIKTEEVDPTATALENEGKEKEITETEAKEGNETSKEETEEEVEEETVKQDETAEGESQEDVEEEIKDQEETNLEEDSQTQEEINNQEDEIQEPKEERNQTNQTEPEQETQEPTEEKSEEMLTSEESKEEVKVAEEDEEEKEETAETSNQEEKSQQQSEEEAEETQEEENGEDGEEETGQESEEKPPPTAESLIARKITPSYPKDASNDAVEGDVKLAVYVNDQGEVNKIEILKEAEDERLTNIAYLTVERGWQFKGGQGNYRITMLVNFKIVNHQHQVNVEFVDLSFVKE